MDLPADLRADCSRCQAVCCVALPFDRSEYFGFDKGADEPCRHLTRDDRCRCFATLSARGQSGCSSYDCYGAGQRVCHELFPGRSWRESPSLAPRLFESFRLLRRVHELRVLIRLALLLPLAPEQAQALKRLLTKLEPANGFDERSLQALPIDELEQRAARSLRACAAAAQARRLPLMPLR